MLNSQLTEMLSNFLAGKLSLPDYRMALMRFRVEQLDQLSDRDKHFVYEVETRFAQLHNGAITEFQFKQLLTAAASAFDSAATVVKTQIWFYSEPQDDDLNTPADSKLSFGNETKNDKSVVYA